ncbi:CLUMA_CG019053, isoform A [Clunio marinus]|uniref:CLUMA_CG019053, isoform A n=1 Tax=Clunio marinus TaxID=568069 RepID=A0A1J1J1R7_9DIPT|nr:CLUMA_CG019053, isoform A [Clunio marinus]
MELNKIFILAICSLFWNADLATSQKRLSVRCINQCPALEDKIRSLNTELGEIRNRNDANMKEIMTTDDMSRFVKLRETVEKQGEGRISTRSISEMNSILAKYYESNPRAAAWEVMAETSVRVEEITKSFDDILNDRSVTDEYCVPCIESSAMKIGITVTFSWPPPKIKVTFTFSF